jgi:hypothetical protein
MTRPADDHAKLPFPTKKVQSGRQILDEYIIPDDKKLEVLQALYISDPLPALETEFFDLHEGKKFFARDYRVIWDQGRNWLMSPYYLSSGGSVIDWMPADFGESDGDEDDEGIDIDDLDAIGDDQEPQTNGDGGSDTPF